MHPVALLGGTPWTITVELPMAPELLWLFCAVSGQCCLVPSRGHDTLKRMSMAGPLSLGYERLQEETAQSNIYP